MTIGRGFVALVAVTFAAVGLAVAADDPRGLNPSELELGRSRTIAAPKLPPPFSAIDNASSDAPKSANPLWGIPVSALKATRERPLFSPSRRPPAPPVVAAPVEAPKAPPPPPPEPEQPALTLVGVVAGQGQGYAVFITTTGHDIVRLRTGEGRDGWILRSVSSREAVLEKNNRQAVVELPPLTGDLK